MLLPKRSRPAAPAGWTAAVLLLRGEGGLMGMVVHPDFATSREFTTCQTHTQTHTEGGLRETSAW